MPRSVNQKPTPLSDLNLSKPQLEKDSVTATSPLPHGSAMANFDPRHSEDRKNDIDWSLQQLAELKVISSQTGIKTQLFLYLNEHTYNALRLFI